MANITISGGYIDMENIPRAPAFIGYYAMSDFWLFDRNPISQSSPYNHGIAYKFVPLTASLANPTRYTYASHVIPSTEDALINANGARWGLFLLDSNHRIIDREDGAFPGLSNFRIASSPSAQNLTDIAGFNTTSLPPVTNGDRIILGDLYAVDGFFSGTVTAVQFVGGGAGLTGVTGATGGVSNTGSTTIAADTDVDGVGIISLQTRTIERVQIANDGALNALFAFNATGLSTLAGGAQFNATQAKWSTGNIGAPSTSDQNQGSREIYYPATLGEHFARGVASGTLWDNVSLAGAYRRYFGADVINSITETNDQCLIQSDSALYTYEFQFGEDNPAILKWSVSGFPLQPSTFQWELDAALIMELGSGAFFPNNDNTTDFGKVAKRWKDVFAATVTVSDEAYDATGWNSDLTVPTKNAVRDKIESLSAGTTINATDGVMPYRLNSTTFANSPITASVPGSMVNGITVTGGATTVMPIIGATGSDTDIGLWFKTKGAGALEFYRVSTLLLQMGRAGNALVELGSGKSFASDATDAGFILSSSQALNLFSLSSGSGIVWSSNATYYGAKDVGIARSAARMLEVNDGLTAGVWGDLKVRQHYVDATMTAGGTTGAQTINKAAGSVNFAAAATSLVVTNSLVTTSSIVIATVLTNDGTLKSVQCVPAAGSFTIHANAAATAETKVAFIVVNK